MSVYLKYLDIYSMFGIGFIKNVPDEYETKNDFGENILFCVGKRKVPGARSGTFR